MTVYETTMGYLLGGVGWLSSLILTIGAVMVIGSRGSSGMMPLFLSFDKKTKKALKPAH